MFISEDLIFIELHKTGSSHIVKLLSSLYEGEQAGKHNAAGPEHFEQGNIFLGSIRNPWDWYLSLWGYGCDLKGSFYKSVASRKPRLKGHGWSANIWQAVQSLLHEPYRKAEEWRNCYTDIDSASNFRKWLFMVHSSDYWTDFGEGYSSSAIKETSGLLTYRYLKLFCNQNHLLYHSKLSPVREQKKFEQNHCYLDFFIRNENLEQDLIDVLKKCGKELSDADIEYILSSKKTNTSSRRKPSAYYYDNESIQLVQQREKLIIDKFGYEPPEGGA